MHLMKKYLLHFLLLLVACQSTVAVADLHETHQTGKEHLEFNHIDQNVTNSETLIDKASVDNMNKLKNISYDCHHCCHCHGVACHYLDNHIVNAFTHVQTSVQFTQFTSIRSRIITPDLRPPII